MNKLKSFCQHKDVVFSPKRYFVDVMSAMALGLFASLLIGTILKTLGQQLGVEFLLDAGTQAMAMMGPAIGVAVAWSLKAPGLVLFASTVTGGVGATLGGPAGAFVAAVVGAEFGKLVSKETKVDIIVTPAVTILIGILVGRFIGPYINAFMVWLGQVIMWATGKQPFLMGIIIAVIMGCVLTLPISSAALCIMLDLSGIAAGAATVGCVAHMVGFAVISFRDNRWGGLLSQGLGTSMLQMGNIVRHPQIVLPSVLTSAILGPLATVVFRMTNTPAGAGMGSAGLVGQIGTLEAMGFTWAVAGQILLLQFLLPAVLSYLFYWLMRKRGWIKDGYMTLDI